METNRLAPIGRTVMVIAAEHGIETRADLLSHLEERGHRLDPTSVGRVLYGRKLMYRVFARALKQAQPLTSDQYQRLANDYMMS